MPESGKPMFCIDSVTQQRRQPAANTLQRTRRSIPRVYSASPSKACPYAVVRLGPCRRPAPRIQRNAEGRRRGVSRSARRLSDAARGEAGQGRATPEFAEGGGIRAAAPPGSARTRPAPGRSSVLKVATAEAVAILRGWRGLWAAIRESPLIFGAISADMRFTPGWRASTKPEGARRRH